MSHALSRTARLPTGPGANSNQHRGTGIPALGRPVESVAPGAGGSALLSARLRPLLQPVQQAFALWRERSRSRRDLARLMPGVRLELLAQGLDADGEARKPFWRA